MAIFGDDVENYAQQQPQQQSFFGGVGSFLLSAVKFIAIAALAITGIGALLSNSDVARDTVDKFTGGKGNGLGTTIANIYDKTKKAIFGPSLPTIDDVAETITVDGNKILKPDPKKFVLNNIEDYEPLRNIKKAVENNHSAIYSEGEEEKKLFKIEKRQDELLTYGLKCEAWNKKVDNYARENEGLLAVGAVPLFPKINLDALPPISDSLNEYGRKTAADWDEKTKVEQIHHLREQVKTDYKSEWPKIKYALDDGNILDNLIYNSHRHAPWVASLGKGNLDRLGLDNNPSIPDETIEAVRLGNIRDAIEKNDLNDALRMAKEASAYFLKTGKALGDEKEMNDEIRKKGEKYLEASQNFDKFAHFITGIQKKDEIVEILNKANSVFIDTSKQLSTNFLPYERRVEAIELDAKIKEQRIAQGVNGNEPTVTAPPSVPAGQATSATTQTTKDTTDSLNLDKQNDKITSLDKDYARLLMKVDRVEISPKSTLPPKKKNEGHEAGITV